jgi:hypothetical protein
MIKATTSARSLQFLELTILLLLILTPFLPWFQAHGYEYGYAKGDGISLWSLLAADATDAIGNLTYDRMALALVLQAGYLTEAIIEMTFWVCTWGYAFARLGEMILARRVNQTVGNILLYGGVVFVMIVGILDYRDMGWGYWASGAILASATGLRLWLSLKQGKISMPPVTG